MSTRRILILNHNLREHGTWFRARKVAAEFHRLGWRTELVTTGQGYYRPRRLCDGPVPVWETPSWTPTHHLDEGWSPLGLAVRLASALSSRDIVYSFSHHPVDQYPARLARLRGALWLCDWCDLYGGAGINAMARVRRGPAASWRDRLRDRLDAWDESLENHAARHADVLTVIGGFLRQRALELGRDSATLLHMPSGAELEAIFPVDRAEGRQHLGLASDAVFLGYIANYHPDLELMLETLRLVRRELPHVQLLAAGNPLYVSDDDLQARGLAGSIIQLGRVPFDNLKYVLGAANVLLVPMTDTEFNRSRWPHKLGDYMAAGRAMACTRVGDVADFVDRHGVAVGAAPEPEAYARAIVDLLKAPGRADELGQSARRVAEQHFSWRRQVERLLDLSERLRPGLVSR
jgi:glycosyltransferase involved in cell wall biosynthesis